MKGYKYLWFAFFCAIALLFYQNRKMTAAKREQANAKRTIDSLRSEIFVLELQLNRYEITLDHFREEDSTLSNKFEEYMSNSTE